MTIWHNKIHNLTYLYNVNTKKALWWKKGKFVFLPGFRTRKKKLENEYCISICMWTTYVSEIVRIYHIFFSSDTVLRGNIFTWWMCMQCSLKDLMSVHDFLLQPSTGHLKTVIKVPGLRVTLELYLRRLGHSIVRL